MLVKNMLDKYKEDVAATLAVVTDAQEKNQLRMLLDLLNTNEYMIDAVSNEFDKDSAPDHVYLFDKERNMFWKGRHGYTRDIYSACLFSKEEAERRVADDYSNNTKIVYFEE